MIEFRDSFLKGLENAAPWLALPLSIVLLLPAPFAFYNSFRKKKLLDKQKDLDSIKSLSWREFEELIAEAYRRKGYSVIENYGVGADGGIDLVLKKAGNQFLVQCKHWKTQKVDVRVVREMYGASNDFFIFLGNERSLILITLATNCGRLIETEPITSIFV